MLRALVDAPRLHSAPTLSLLAESTFMVTLTHAGILWALDPLGLAAHPAVRDRAASCRGVLALVVRHTRASQLLTGMPRRPRAAAWPAGHAAEAEMNRAN